MILKKIAFSKISLLIVIFFVSNALMYTPLQPLNIIFNSCLVAFFLFLYFLLFILKYKYQFSTYFFLLSLLPIIASIQANFVFGQPIFDGIIGNLTYYLFLVSTYFIFYLEYNKKFDLKIIEKNILRLGWIFGIVYVLMQILYPSDELIIKSLGGSGEDITIPLSAFSAGFSLWAAFIYLGYTKIKSKFLIFFLILLCPSFIFKNGRTFILALFITFVVYFFKELKKIRRVYTSLILILMVLFAFIYIQYSPTLSKSVNDKFELFVDAINVSTGNEIKVNDDSALARISEIETANKYISANPLFGAGILRSSTKNLYLSDYFYATDIGLIGVIFNYGYVGLIILLYQIVVFFKLFSKKCYNITPFMTGTKYYLLLLYILSIFSGQFAYSIGSYILLLTILQYGLKNCE